ncbi:MAG TPA: glycosyltransferase family 4 protein [Gemmatimonadales bacterium]|jgi:glycosyltransferase involved in cell wall biosynthesis|nr:glycosyltransferase family 4 protein [Gemmatimonadales bacterium]
MKVLALTRYGRLGASSRLRFYQYLPRLEQGGIAVTVAELSPDEYVARLYAGRRPPVVSIARDYLRRARWLVSLRGYDLLWIEKELFPGAPALVERLLSGLRVPYVVDFDDATFHRYDRSANPLLRHLWPRKIDAVMRGAALVVAGNQYLAERARAAGARRVELLPTVVDPARYPVRPPPAGEPFTVGWMGTPVTQRYLAPVAPSLAAVVAAGGRVRLVGADRLPEGLPAESAELRPWAEATEASDILAFDVGIMPLDDTEWERGKCGYKLLQYMAAGRPVVASPVGVNPEIVDPGVTGFLAATPDEWRTALARLRDDPALRIRMGEAGRRRLEAGYSLDLAEPRLRALLRSACTTAGRR